MTQARPDSGALHLCTIYHGPAVRPAAFGGLGHWRRVANVADLGASGDTAAVLIADTVIAEQVVAASRLSPAVLVLAATEDAEKVLGTRAQMSVAGFRSRADRQRVLQSCCRLACARERTIRQRRQLGHANHELRELHHIGMQLMHEHDLATLLDQILTTAKSLTTSDGGALLLVDREAARPQLVLHRWDFDSIPRAELTQETLPVDDASIAGHAARIRRPIVVADAYDLPPNVEFMLDRDFDERHGYRRRSMLFVPMVDHLDHLAGLLLLVNRKVDPAAHLVDRNAVERYVVPFTRRDIRVARSLASLAAVAIENAQLYERIERTLDSIVEAAVSAIDARDPATAGHSLRVADLSTRLAKAVDRAREGPYRDVRFTAEQLRELRFAALLHDVGKLVVPEHILLKAKKLPPLLRERVMARFDLARVTLELEHCGASSGHDGIAAGLAEVERMRRTVCRADEPSVMDGATDADLARIAGRSFRGPYGRDVQYLTDEERHFLELRRGTLDDGERALVERHAEASFRFLSHIPWTDSLQNVPVYAYDHHEKLDGSGYPRQLRANDIPLQARIITLADMFDALTESDRPYKPALTAARALEILEEEAGAGRLDAALLHIMAECLVDERSAS